LLVVPIGSAIGVYMVGNIGDETGNFSSTLGGSILGGLVLGGGGMFILHKISPRLARRYFFLSAAMGSTIGAVIFFHAISEGKPSAASRNPAAPAIYLDFARVIF